MLLLVAAAAAAAAAVGAWRWRLALELHCSRLGNLKLHTPPPFDSLFEKSWLESKGNPITLRAPLSS